jgi:uncharacterized membrane protein YbhN (UPF0104 family)
MAASAGIPWRWIARVGLTVVALGVIVWILPAGQLWSALRSVPVLAWPVAIAAYLAAHLVGVYKWRLLVNAGGAGLAARPAGQAYYWGLFGNLFLPSIVGGDLVRAGVAFRHARSRSALLLGSLADRILDVAGLGVLAGAGALLSPRALDATSRRVFLTFLAVATVAAIAGLLLLWTFPVRRLPYRVRRKLVQVRRAIRATTARPGAIVLAFSSGILLQSALVVLNWQLGRLVQVDVPLYVWFFVWPLAKIAALTPLTQGGIGVREAALAALFLPFGVPAVHAVASGLVFEGVLVVGGLIAGGIAVGLGRRNGPAVAAGSLPHGA